MEGNRPIRSDEALLLLGALPTMSNEKLQLELLSAILYQLEFIDAHLSNLDGCIDLDDNRVRTK